MAKYKRNIMNQSAVYEVFIGVMILNCYHIINKDVDFRQYRDMRSFHEHDKFID